MKLRNRQSGEIKEFVLFDGKEMQAGLTLENLARYWEDYTPKEPLIKDEKIRKAVRAWAEANEISQAQFDRYTSGFSASDDGHNLLSMISFDGFVFMFVDGKYYTIDELCGEEEE